MTWNEQQVYEKLSQWGGDKTRTLNWYRKWYPIEGTDRLDELYRIIDSGPGQWNMQHESLIDRIRREMRAR